MRNLFLITIMMCLVVVTSCSSNTTTADQQTSDTSKMIMIPSAIEIPVVCQPRIPVGKENFTKLVTFIEKKGFAVKTKGIPSDYQYTFYDSKENRHAMITIKRDENDEPSLTGTVGSISVWGHVKGMGGQKNYFGYAITQDSAFSFTEDEEHFLDIKLGYEEFLEKATSK